MQKKALLVQLFVIFLFTFSVLFLMTQTVFSQGLNIPQDNWSLFYVSSEETVRENGRAVNAFDGKTNTIWHTRYSEAVPKHPHEIDIDLGAIYVIEGFRYLPRQDTSVNGTIKDYEFFVASDRNGKGLPVAKGTFANSKAEKTVMFTAPVTGRYINLIALNEVNGGAWTSIAELNVIGHFYNNENAIELPYGAVKVTIEPSKDNRATGHYLYLKNTVTGETTKSDMAKAVFQVYQAAGLSAGVVYQVTATAYGQVGPNFMESVHSNAFYFKLEQAPPPPPMPLDAPSIMSVERIN